MGLLGLGESKTLAWGFAMVPHRLRALNVIKTTNIFLLYALGAQKNHLIETVLLSTHSICFG